MQNFFTPKSVAVIGVSKSKNKVGSVIFNNLKKYKGNLYAINSNEKNVQGVKAYPSILNIKEKIDLAILAIPARFVIQTVNDCGKKGIKHLIIVTSGFAEIGNTKLEYELYKALEKNNIKCIGPNCLGVYDAHSKLDSLFLPTKQMTRPKAGGISFISQSGALGSALVDIAAYENYGFAKFISYGNATNLSETDLLSYLGKDKQTKIICMYIEGIKDGKKFMDVAKKIDKPIIVIKGGRTEKGSKAAMSHTGSLAGSFQIYRGAFKQSNIILADSLQEMFHIAKLFNTIKMPKGRKVQVITNGGGYGIVTTDLLEENNIQLSELSKRTTKRLTVLFPKICTIKNPMDLVGDATDERYGIAIDACMRDDNVDLLLIILLPQTPLITKNIIKELKKNTKKPMVFIVTGGKKTQPFIKSLENNNFPVFQYPSEAVKAIKKFFS
ncbi:MAG: CoA-binding protein [archaeon]